MSAGLIVSLVGPDGSGKTTVARKLVESELGLPAEYLYMGYNARHSNRLLPTTRLMETARARWRRKEGRGGRPRPHSTERRAGPRRRRRGPLAAALRVVHAASRLLEDAYRQYLAVRSRRAGRIVLLDRDSLIDFHATGRADDRARSLGLRIRSAWLSRVYRRPDLVVYLDAPPETLWARKGEHTLEWLAERRRDYLAALELVPRHAVVDATRPLDDVTREVAGIVRAAVRRDPAQ